MGPWGLKESDMTEYLSTCVKQIASRKLPYSTGSSVVLCDNLRSGRGGGVGCGGDREAQEGEDMCIHIAVSGCCTAETQHCKAIILQ